MGKYAIIIGIAFLLVIAGCHSTKEITSGKKKKISSQNLEYNYAFTEATKQFVFGNFKQAMLLYQKCIEVNPSSAASFYQLSVIFTNVGEIERAIKYSKTAMELNNEEIWYKLNLANLYNMAEKTDSAIYIYKKIVKNDNENIEHKFTLAGLYHKNMEYKEALEILNAIEHDYGITEKVSIQKHQIYKEIGKGNLAEKTIVDLIELDPENVKYYGILAEFYSDAGMDRKAEDIYDKIMKMDGNNALVYMSTAEHYAKKGEYEKAFDYYKKGLDGDGLTINEKIRALIRIITRKEIVDGNEDEIIRIINGLLVKESKNVRLLTLRADFYVRIKKFGLAEKDLEEVLKKETENFIIWEQLLYIKSELKKNESLLKYSNKALEKFPEQPSVYMFKGLAEMQLNKSKEAVKSLENGLRRSGENRELKIQFLTFLGDTYRNLGENQKSDQAFEEVLRMDPNNLIVLNNYSYYLSLRKERLEAAEKYSRKTIEKEPRNPTYLDTYAWILFNMNDLEGALKYIKKAYDNGGNKNPEILEHYGDILFEMGKKGDALLYWKAASVLDKSNKDLVEKIRLNE